MKRQIFHALVLQQTGFHHFAWAFLPWLGVSALEKAIINILASLEKIENVTIDAIQTVQLETTSLSQVTLQKHMALDYLVETQKGVCALINNTRCFYVNQDKKRETDINQI